VKEDGRFKAKQALGYCDMIDLGISAKALV
jgi:hypothetical protein